MSCGGLSLEDSKINFLRALVWWVIGLTMCGKPIELNRFQRDILSGSIDYSRLDYKDTIDISGTTNPGESGNRIIPLR